MKRLAPVTGKNEQAEGKKSIVMVWLYVWSYNNNNNNEKNGWKSLFFWSLKIMATMFSRNFSSIIKESDEQTTIFEINEGGEGEKRPD
jgi:hypothetical protein